MVLAIASFTVTAMILFPLVERSIRRLDEGRWEALLTRWEVEEHCPGFFRPVTVRITCNTTVVEG
jgi:hypothetical protein